MNRQPGRVRVIAIGFFLSVGIFLLGGMSRPPKDLIAAQDPLIAAEFCMAVIWKGCFEDPADGQAVVTMTRVNLGDGIYEDIFEYRGTHPETGEPIEYFERVRSFRGLIPIRRTVRFDRIYVKSQHANPDSDWRRLYSIDDFHYSHDPDDLDKAYQQLFADQKVSLKIQGFFQWQETYYCPLEGSCNEWRNTKD